MSLKKLGKIGAENILLWIVISFIPLFTTCFYLYTQIENQANLKNRYENILHFAKSTLDKRIAKNQFLDRFLDKDPYYLETYLENLHFLKEEKQMLQDIKTHPAFANKEKLKQRFDFFQKGKNKLKFLEQKVEKTNFLQEAVLHQIHPVELEEKDLMKLLSSFEQRVIGSYFPDKDSPQFMIKKMTLKKKRDLFSSEIFSIQMDLLKREFLTNRKKS